MARSTHADLAARGGQGLGYDPMFRRRTFPQLRRDAGAREKHACRRAAKGLSHRARAFLKLADACLTVLA